MVQDVPGTAATDVSIFDNLKVLSNSGGLFYSNVLKELILSIYRADITNLEVYQSGAVIGLDGTAKYTVNVNHAKMTGNTANNGNAAIVFAASTTDKTSVTMTLS